MVGLVEHIVFGILIYPAARLIMWLLANISHFDFKNNFLSRCWSLVWLLMRLIFYSIVPVWLVLGVKIAESSGMIIYDYDFISNIPQIYKDLGGFYLFTWVIGVLGLWILASGWLKKQKEREVLFPREELQKVKILGYFTDTQLRFRNPSIIVLTEREFLDVLEIQCLDKNIDKHVDYISHKLEIYNGSSWFITNILFSIVVKDKDRKIEWQWTFKPSRGIVNAYNKILPFSKYCCPIELIDDVKKAYLYHKNKAGKRESKDVIELKARIEEVFGHKISKTCLDQL